MNQPNSSRTTGPIREYGIVILILAALILLFWWRIWIPSLADSMHFSGDIFVKDYPTRIGLFRQLLNGFIPLWDPYQFGGWPGFANCEAGLLYPFNWVLIPFSNSPESAFQVTQWLVLLHFFIAGLGAYRLARYIGLSPLSAGLSAIAFTFCGFHCAHKQHTNMLFTIVWFPWMLLLAERWIREDRIQCLMGLSLLMALAYLAGHPQSSLYITLLLTARLVYGVYEKHNSTVLNKSIFTTRVLPILAVLVLAPTLAAIQLYPTMELIRESARSNADVFQSSVEFSLPPLELVEAFLPEAMRFISQNEVFYWGLIPLLLALHTLIRGKLDPLFKYLLGVFIVAVTLSLGEHLFAYDISYLLVPGAAWVRAPSRWIYFASLPLALAAGRELDYFLRQNQSAARKALAPMFWKIVWCIVGLLVITLLWAVISTGFNAAKEVQSQLHQSLLRSFLYMVMFGGVFLALFHAAAQQRIRPVVFAISAIVLCWFDLGTHFRTFDLAPGPGGYSIDDEVDILHQSTWNHRTKVLFAAGGNRTLYHGAAQDFYEFDGQSPLTPRIHLELRDDVNIPFPSKPNLSLLRLLGTGAILTDLDEFPLQITRQTERLHFINNQMPRAWSTSERFHAEQLLQRRLLILQSFPFRQVILTDEESSDDHPEIPDNALFPLPFLLASCSAQATEKNAFLVINGKNYFEGINNDEPGYYFAVADQLTGEVEDVKGFNLMKGILDAERLMHQRMLKFFSDIPDGKFVFAAIKDNATNNLLPIGLAALRSIGASLDVRGEYQLAHAIVGRKGAPIGSALEIYSATEALVLQTEKSFYMNGFLAPKPQPIAIASEDKSIEWRRFYTEINEMRPHDWRFDISANILGATGAMQFAAPVMIFSAPKKTGEIPATDSASILIGGREFALNKRGYNLVVAEPEKFNVIASDSFDLLKDFDPSIGESGDLSLTPMENRRMREFINSVEEGNYIFGAIRDDGTDLMTRATRDVLHELGSEFILSIEPPDMRKHNSHAFIAVKGASHFIEIGGQEKDAFIYTRYPGGPALSHAELNSSVEQFIPENPMDEIERIACDTQYPTPPDSIDPWGVEEISPSHLRLTGKSDGDELLFISEIFYPGWKAYVDGVLKSIKQINYYFRGIEVKEGRHEIELVYWPESIGRGAAISILALVALVLWWFIQRFSR